jgi:hypothetical protein
MKTTIFSFQLLAAIIAATILQACAGTPGIAGTQCAQPTLNPPERGGSPTVTVTITTATTGAHLRYTLDGIAPTAGHGTLIAAASGKVTVSTTLRGKTLKAIAFKAGLANSLIAVGTYYRGPIP